MSEEQQFALNWKKHNDYFLSVVNGFFSSKFLTDIDLICQDNKKIGCHKVVLATFSQFFYKIFSEQLSSEKSFAMVNIKYDDMKMLLDYMYTGEINVTQEDLPRITELADFLKIKGFKENLPKELQQNGKQLHNGKHEASQVNEKR